MNAALATTCTIAFFAFVPGLLVVRFLFPSRLPWWVVVLTTVALGWVLINLFVRFDDAHVNDLVDQAGGLERAPPELVEEWSNDGGPRTFAFLFGWLLSIGYLAAWLVAYGVAYAVRHKRGARSSLLRNKSLETRREG